MPVHHITPSGAAAPQMNTTSDKVPPKALKPDEFIKIFLAQLKNQNPMHPSDSNTMLQQMTDISSISASKSLQDSMAQLSQDIKATLANNQVLEATQLIGKKVEVPSNGTASLSETGDLEGSVMMPDAASNVKVAIKDTAGNLIETLDLGPCGSAGLVNFKWDGMLSDKKTRAKPGVYQVTATAMIKGKQEVPDVAGAFKVLSIGLNRETGGVLVNLDNYGGIGMEKLIKILG